MEIHIVEPGETIYTIADQYKVPVERVILDNDIDPNKLVVGETILILYPSETYIVKSGDTLQSIAESFHITQSQLLRNNNFLIKRNSLLPGENLVISYPNNLGTIYTNGYINPFVEMNTFKRTLPYLSYISVFGYRTSENADIVTIEDAEIVKMAKAAGVAPLMLLSAFTFQGFSDIKSVYDILIDESLANKHIENIIKILKDKGYYGINITYQFINAENLILYRRYTEKLYQKLKEEGFKLFITVSPKILEKEVFSKIDKSVINFIDGITFMDYTWGKNFDPPSPVTSVKAYDELLKTTNAILPDNIIDIGCPIIGYDWELPYVEGKTVAKSLKLNTALDLAYVTKSIIKFDEISKTPYFSYRITELGVSVDHIVWFVDSRTINSILDLVRIYNLRGTGIWNVMYFYSQMWMVINSQYKIEKLFPEP